MCVCVCVYVCQCAKFDQFLPGRFHFESKRPENFVRIAKFPYAAFGPLFAFHCPGGMETEIAKLVGAGWMNWKKCSGVLCDKKMPVKLKGKVYRTVVRPAMLYGAETWATTKRQESRIEVNEMRMLRWMCGVTRKDKIRNEHIRGTTKVAQASRKITERRLKWYGHVMRMEEDHVVKRVTTKAIPGKRKRGRPKTRWKDVCKMDMQTVGLREGDAGDRDYWKEMINNHSGDPR